MKVAVLEYLSGGGLSDEKVSTSLRHEGMAMLSALANDLVQCGHQVHTCLDRQASQLSDPLVDNVRIHEIPPANLSWSNKWDEIAHACDRTIVIAPELAHQLEQIVERLRSAGSVVVASSKEFLRATSDKLVTAELLSKSHVAHPSTCTLSQFLKDPENTISPSPVTVKRRDGAGCADMKYFDNPRLFSNWLSQPNRRDLNCDDWIVQPWLAGRPASIAILASEQWHVLSAVEQFIQLEPSDSGDGSSDVIYVGGSGPLRAVTREQLEQLAKKVRAALPLGAYGWIGIDFLVPVSSPELVVIEVNPRLTTSYLGYRKWYGHKLANALLADGDCNSIASQFNATLPLHEYTKWGVDL